MDVEEIDEAVSVGTVFKASQIIPKWFIRGPVKYEIAAVNMVWKGREGEGEAALRYFSVLANGNTYQLRLNQKTMEWRLVAVSTQ